MPQLTPKENFRLGFLLRCAEEGLDADGIKERVKIAIAGGFLQSAGNLAKLVGTLPLHATGYGMAGGAILGGAAGYGLAKMQNSDVDPEEAKRQELIAAYKLQADLARRRAAQRSYRRMAPAEPKLF